MILRGNVYSKKLEMETGITVIAPNDYRNNEPYQVVYLLHGLMGRSGDWADYTMLPEYAKDYHAVFIMPEAARSFYFDMRYGLQYFSYVKDELPLICQSIFNISAEREDTAVMGASMGGYGALKCALSSPEKYGYCCAFSSACLFMKEALENQGLEVMKKETRELHGDQLVIDFEAALGENLDWAEKDDILELAKRAKDQPLRPKIYCTCGTEDYLHEDHLKFREKMAMLDLDFCYEEWTGSHNWYFFNESIEKALKWCFGA